MIEDNITDITTAPAEQPVPIIDEQTQQTPAVETTEAPPPVEPEKPAVVLKDIDFFNNNVDWHNSNLAEGEKPLVKYKFAQDIPDEEYNGLKAKVEAETVNWHNKLSEKHPELKIGKIKNAWDINKDNYDKLTEVDNADRKQSELTQYNELVKQLPSNSGIKPLKNVNDFTPEMLDNAKAKYTEKVNLNLKKQGYTGEGFKDFGSIDWKLIDEYNDKSTTEEENKKLREIKSKYKSLSDVPEFTSKEDADARRSELNKKIKELDSQKTVSDWNEQAKTINAKFGVNVPIVKSESELPAANEKFKKIAAAYGNTATATPAYTKMEFPISPFATQPGGVRGDIPAPNLATEPSQFNWQKKREDFLKESKKMFYQSKADKEFFSKSADLGISPESRTLVTGENIGAPLKWNVTIEDEVAGNDINDHKKQAYYRAASDQLNNDVSKLDEQIKATAEQIKTATPDEQQAILEKRNRIIKARGILVDKQHEFSSNRHEIRSKAGSTANAFLYKIAESGNDMFAGALHFASQGLKFGVGWMASDDEWNSINKKISEFGAQANTGAQLFFHQTPENVENEHKTAGFLGGMVPYVAGGEMAIPMMFFSSFNSNTEKYKDLPSSQSFVLNSLQSAASAYIMGKGLEITKGHGVINSAVLNFIEQSAGKIKLSNLFPYLDKVIGATTKVGTTSISSGLSFAVLNPVGVATTYSIDKLNNAISKNKVDTQDFVEVIKQMGESAVDGMKDGIILGGVMTPVNEYQTGKLNRSTFSDATKLRDQRVMSSNINIIKQAHANDKIDKQTASNAIKNLVDLRKSITSIDEKLSIPDQYEAWKIMQDNKRLDHESSGLSDFFKAPYERQKQSNNEKLQNIAMKHDQVYQHEKEGGSSFVNGKNAMGSKGTSVSIFPERTVIIDRPLTQKDLDDFKEKNKDILEGNEDVLSVGTWKDGEGKTNIDISSVTPHAEAEELGKKYNQQAVFNLEKGTSVPTGGTGEEIEGLKSEAERIKDIREIAGRTKASEADFKPISLEELTTNLGEENKIIKAVRNGMSAVSGLSDKNNISINFHDTNTSMQSAMNKGGAADKEAKKTRGNFSYIRNDNGGWDMSIDINLKAGADATTIRHEFTHGVLLHAFGEAPEMINKMKDAFRSYGNMFNDSKLIKFADMYAKEGSAEEYLAELSAISNDIKPGALAKIAEFINNVAAKYLGDKFVPFKDVNDSNDIIRYFGSMANAVRTGAPVEIREMAAKESENKAEDEVIKTKEAEGANKSKQQRITAEDALLLDTSEKREKKKVTEVAFEFEKAVDKILSPSSEKEQRTQRFLVNAFQDLRYFLGEYKGDTGLDWYTNKIKEFGEKLKDISDIAINKGELSNDKSLRDKENMDMFNVVLSLSSIGINPKENVKVAFEIWKNFDKNGMVFSKYQPGTVSFRTKVKQTNGAYWAPSGEIIKETKTKYIFKQSDNKIIEVKKSDLLPANEIVYKDVNKNGKVIEKTKELRLIKKTDTNYVFKSGDGIIKIPIEDVLSIEKIDDGLVGKGWSVKGNIIAINLERLESLMGNLGSIPKTIEWLSKKHPIEELRKYNSSLPDINGKKGKTNNEGERIGSYIIGEKLGAFHQNVAGTPTELTMDLWWSRTWNRYMGTLMTVDEKGQPSIQETPRTDSERAVMRESAEIAAKTLGLEVHELQAALWYLEQQVYKKMGAAVESYSFVDGVNSLLLKYGKTEQEIQPERYGINSSEVDTRRADAASRAANILYEGLGEKSETEPGEAPKSKQSLVDDAKMTKDMTEDEKGNYLFYHYSPGKIPNIDPRHFGKNLRTGRDERPGIGVSMYYTRPDRRDVGGSYGYVVRVPKDKVYPFNSDPMNLMDKAKATFEKMYPGQAFDKNKQVAFVSQEAAKAGYDMTVAKWGNDLRAQTTKVMKGETYEKPHPDYHTSTVFNPKLEKYVANENKPKSKQQLSDEENKDTDIAYHGTPYNYESFDPSKIGSGEGASKRGKGIYFNRSKRLAPYFANINSEDSPIHIGTGKSRVDKSKIDPQIIEVSGINNLNLKKGSSRDISAYAKNQNEFVKRGFDGFETERGEITVFPESIDKITIKSKLPIKEFVDKNKNIEFREWSAVKSKQQLSEEEKGRGVGGDVKPTPNKVKVLGKDVNMYNDYIPSKAEDVEPDAMYSFNADSKDGIPSILHDVAYANKRDVNGVKTENWHASISGDELLKLYPEKAVEQSLPTQAEAAAGGDVKGKNIIKDKNEKEQSIAETPKPKKQLSSDDIRDNMDKMFEDYSKKMKGRPVEEVINRVIDEVQHDWVKEGREIDLENAIRSFKEENGIKVKTPPSQAKISGEKPKEITITERTALKDQIKLEINAANKAAKSVVDARKAITDLVKGSKDSFTRADYEKIMSVISNVKDEASLNKAFDKIVEIEKKSKASDIKEVSEFKELKDKVRLIYEAAKEGKKSVVDPLREIAAKLKEMEGRGQITANQAKVLLNRFANVNTANPDMVDRYLDYAEKVFDDADYADKLNEAREINRKVNKAIKSREVESELRMAAKEFTKANVTKVEDIDAHLEMGRRLLDATSSSGIGIKEGEISDRTRKAINIKELSDYTDEVAQKIAEMDEANLLEATGIDVKSEEPDTVAPSIEDYIRDRFNAMADSIRDMIKSGISPIDGEKYDLSDEDKIKLSKLVKMTADDITDPKDKIRALEAMDHLLTNGVMGRIPYILNKIKMSKDVDRGISERVRVTSGKVGLLAIENAVQGIRKILSFSGNSKFYHALLRNSTRRIDNVIKNYTGFEIFNNGIKQIAQGESSYKTDLNTMNSDKLKNELVKSMGGDFNKVIESGFKMTMYLRQLEHESNPGSKKSPPAMAFVEKTIEASMSGKHPMNEKSAKLLKKLSELYSTDGNIDSKKIWDSFSPAEKKVVEGIRKLYDTLTPYAQKVASEIHDQPFDPFENYTTIVTQNTSRGAEQVLNEKGKLNAAIGITPAGSIKTKAGQIEERTGQASPINFDPFSSANKAVRNVMLDYHMTLPLRTMSKITDGFIAKSLEMYKADPSKENESRLLFAKAMRKTFEDVLEATLSRSFFHRDIWSDVKDYVSRASTTYMLSNPSKSASEAVSNLSYVVPNYPEEMALGITEYKDYSLNGVGGEIMRNLNSYATDRAYPHGTLSGAFLSPESYEISTNDMQNVRGFAVNAATKAYYNSLMAPQKGLRAVSETMLTAPDLAIIRPLWFGSMAKNFKKITGQDIDFEAIAKNDVNYLDKFEDALNKSRDIADKNVTDTGAAKNPWLMSPITVKRHGTLLGQTQNYLANYSRNEYEITTDAIIAMHRGGKMSRADAVKQISGVLLRAGSYTAIRGVIASGLAAAGIAMHHFLYDDDDKDELTQAITEGRADSNETRKIAAKNQINFLTKTSPRIPGIDPSIDLNNVMMTSDKNKFTMKELQERASDENTFSDNFIKGVGNFVAQGVLGRNFGNIQNKFFTSTAVEYLNAKYLHPEDYNRYKNNILYSSWPDFNSKDAYQKTIEAAIGPYGKASSAAWAVGTSINDYLESQSKIKAIDENLRKIDSGEKVPVEQIGLDYRDKLIKEKNKLIRDNKKNVPAYFRDAIISGLATMGTLPGAKDFENVMTKAMKPTMVELSDYDELKEKYKFYKGSVKGTIWGTPGEKDDRESEYYKMTHAGFELTPEGWIKK